MAEKGTFTAYQQLRPLQGDISSDIQQQEENGFRRRTEKRVEDEIAQRKKDKASEEKKALWDKYVKPLSNYDTGSKTLNEAQGRLLIEAQKQYVPLMSVLNSSTASDEEKLKATLKLQNLNNLPENLAQFTKSLTDRDIAYRKAVADGKIYADPKYETNFQEGYANKLLSLDENGMPLIAFRDENGDGVNDVETYDQVKNIVGNYEIQARFDRDKELLEASTKLQPEVNQTDNGFQREKTTAINPDLLNQYVANQLFEADGVTPTPKMKSFAREAGVSLSDTQKMKQIAESFKNDIRLRVKGGTEVTRNYNNLDVQKEANAQKERDKNNKISYGIVTTPPAYKEAGFDSMNGYKTVAVQGKVTMPAISFKAGKNKEVITNGQVQSYTVVKNGAGQRTIVAEIAYEDEKSTRDKESGNSENIFDSSGTTVTTGERKQTKILPLTEAQADVFARQLGFKNVNQMKDSARSGEKEEESNSSTQGTVQGGSVR